MDALIAKIQAFPVPKRAGEIVLQVALPDEPKFVGVISQGQPARVYEFGKAIEVQPGVPAATIMASPLRPFGALNCKVSSRHHISSC